MKIQMTETVDWGKGEDAWIHLTMKSAMQSIATYVRKGYTWHVSGQLIHAKSLKFARKMHRQYGCSLDKIDLERASRAGYTRTRLILLATPEYTHWWLLVSTHDKNAKGDVWLREKLQDCTSKDTPIKLLNLVLRAVTGPKTGNKTKSRWQWRFARAYAEIMHDKLNKSCRQSDLSVAKKMTGELMTYPCYHKIRYQRKAIFDAARSAGVHAGHSLAALEFMPTAQGTTRFTERERRPLEAWLIDFKESDNSATF